MNNIFYAAKKVNVTNLVYEANINFLINLDLKISIANICLFSS